MPRKKPQRPLAPIRLRRSHPILPAPIVAKLAGLAAVSSDEIFRNSITFAVEITRTNPARRSGPLFAGPALKRLNELLKATRLLQKLLHDIQDPQDRLAYFLYWNLGRDRYLINLTSRLSGLADSIEKAKNSAVIDLEKRGRPSGVGGRGEGLGRFITVLEYAALAAGGDWTLNKNDASGTLIDALELLRASLPNNFLPRKHP